MASGETLISAAAPPALEGDSPTVAEPVPVTVSPNDSAGPPTDVPRGDSPAPTDAAAEPAEESALGQSAGDRLVLSLLSGACLVLLAIHWVRLTGWGARPIEIDRQTRQTFEYHLDVNTATWVELAQLEDVGDVLARRIVEDRVRNGPYASVDDLRRVKGIGAKTLEKLRPWIRASQSEAGSAPSGASKR